MSAEQPITLTPQDIILSAFEYFHTDRLDLESLIRIGAVANSPSAEVTQGVIANLIGEGMLNYERDVDNRVWITIPPVDQSQTL